MSSNAFLTMLNTFGMTSVLPDVVNISLHCPTSFNVFLMLPLMSPWCCLIPPLCLNVFLMSLSCFLIIINVLGITLLFDAPVVPSHLLDIPQLLLFFFNQCAWHHPSSLLSPTTLWSSLELVPMISKA